MSKITELSEELTPISTDLLHIVTGVSSTAQNKKIEVGTLLALAIAAESSVTDNAIVRWDGTGGGAVQNSGITINDDNTMTFPDSATVTPIRLSVRNTEPSTPLGGGVYLDDGTNTASGVTGWRRWTGAAWEDIGATAGGGGTIGGSTGATDNAILRADGTGGSTIQASGVTIDDSGNLDLGGAEIRDFAEQIVTANTTANYAIDFGAGTVFELTLTADCTFTLSNLVAGKSVTLKLIQDGTGSRTATWPGVITWPDGEPTLKTAASARDIVILSVRSDGTNLDGWGGAVVPDAADVTYTPTTLSDWTGSADPGNADDALDQLAGRVTVNESDIVGLSSGGIASSGWTALGQTLAYSSADDPTYVATCSGVDLTSTLSVGMRLRVSQTTGGTKYFIITAIAFSTNTTLTLYGGTDYNLENEAISNPYFSPVKAPLGFPLDPGKWTVTTTDTTSRSQASPSAGTWYNLGSQSISIPVGLWDVSYAVLVMGDAASGTTLVVESTLSTGNNNESDSDFTNRIQGGSFVSLALPVVREKVLTLSSKTAYYLNTQAVVAGYNNIYNRNDASTLFIRARCAYL